MARHLLQRLAPELGREGLNFADEAIESMQTYAWPGNVRELANAAERGVIIAQGEAITADDLVMDEVLPVVRSATEQAEGESTASIPDGALLIPAGERNLATIERLIIQAALSDAEGRKSKAAEMLGINRTTLYHKLREISEELA